MASISSLLDVSRRALSAQTQAIRVIGSNVANVNTPGYSRRKAELVSTAPGRLSDTNSIGTGVELKSVIRQVDEFLNTEYLRRLNDTSKQSVRDEILSRAQSPFSLDGTNGRIGSQLSEFFSALDDMAVSPSDIPLRDRVIETGQALTQSIRSAFQQMSDLQRETDTRVGVQVTEVNRLSGEVASLNEQIGGSEIQGQENLALRDQRDELLRSLSKIVSIKTVDGSDGQINVTLDNGFALVVGNSAHNLEFVKNPSFAPPGGFPNGLDGAGLGHVVYNFGDSTTRSDIELTNVIATGGGEISGLLSLRGVQAPTDTSPFNAKGDLVDLATRVESLARDLLTRFNLSYRGADETPGGTLQPSAGDLDGTQPGVYSMFTATGVTDTDADGVPEAPDLTTAVAYAGEITFGITDSRKIAAALDLNPASGSVAFAPGDGRNIANLAALRNQATSYSLGNFSANSTIEELYQTTVSHAGSIASTAKGDLTVSQARQDQVGGLKDSISGVSLDEEFANLINFQRAFQASAKLITTGNDLFGEVLNLIR